MRRLIIDTATRACSVALFEGDACLGAYYEEIGRGHAERLVPMIAQLPDRGRADSIHVNVGPGSFTGIRVGVSAARALALAWKVPCHGYGCLDLVAAMARNGDALAVDVAMTGGHGEVYFQSFDASGVSTAPPVSLPPAQAAEAVASGYVVGDMADAIIGLRGTGEAKPTLPDARRWLEIADVPPTAPQPAYVRGPDAKLPGGRTA
jgi:tRNA threonylcarbamoyladenosine biosynthesis protein TsaB